MITKTLLIIMIMLLSNLNEKINAETKAKKEGSTPYPNTITPSAKP